MKQKYRFIEKVSKVEKLFKMVKKKEKTHTNTWDEKGASTSNSTDGKVIIGSNINKLISIKPVLNKQTYAWKDKADKAHLRMNQSPENTHFKKWAKNLDYSIQKYMQMGICMCKYFQGYQSLGICKLKSLQGSETKKNLIF